MEKQFLITDPVGLHARPATLLVNEASKFASEAKILVEDKEVNLKSIMGVMALGITTGTKITIQTNGEDEADAIEALAKIIESSNIGQEQK